MSTSKREIAALPSGHVGIYRAVRQLGAVEAAAPGLVAGEQCKLSFRFRLPFARQLLRLGDLRGGHFGSDLTAGRSALFERSPPPLSACAAAKLYHMCATT
jgi:hypothetical protein